MWAAAASVALHGVLLWPQPLPRTTPQLGLPLQATLRPAPALAAAQASGPPPAAAPRGPTSGRVAALRPSSRLTVDRDRKLPSPSVASPTPRAAEAAAEPAPEPPDLGTADSDRRPPAALFAPIESAPDGPDGPALREFRIAVARRVGQHDFPELAEEIGRGNASVLRVVVGPEAGMAKVAVARSSGFARLDARARELIGAGVRATALPEALRGREFVTEFRVEFRPRDDARPD